MSRRRPTRSAARLLPRLACIAAVLTLISCSAPQPAPSPAPAAIRVGDGYYLTQCARCDQALGAAGEPVKHLDAGRELIFCGEACRTAFERDRATGLARIDAVMMIDQRPFYPTSSSIISGRPLDARAVEFVWNNRLIRVADEQEHAAFIRDPDPAIRNLDRAVIDYRLPRYDIEKCLVQGVVLEEDTAVNVVVANRLFRVCCGQCAGRIRANPRMHTAIVDYAWARATRDPAR